MRKHFLDLFSGLGGASEAFAQDLGNWTVLRIDNNPLLSAVPNTVIRDIMQITPLSPKSLMFPKPPQIDCIWASPPCTEFSNAFNSPRSEAARAGDDYEPDMSLLEKTMEIIETVKPKYWVIQNVVGSIRYFAEYLGEPRQIIGPYVLWGNFPWLADVKVETKKSKDVHSGNPLRSNLKAKVDFNLSQALKDAIDGQRSISDFM